MRRVVQLAVTVVGFAGVACQAIAADKLKRESAGLSAPGAAANASSRDAEDEEVTIVIAPRTWFLFLEEPNRYFENAFEDFKNHRFKESARDIRRAATLLKIEAAGADKAQREPLEAAIFGLEVLGEEVAAGKVKRPESLAKMFALAHYQMARFHEGQTDDQIKEGDLFEAGQELQAANHHLDEGFVWAGSPRAEGFASLIQGVSTIAGQLLAGADAATAARAEQALRDTSSGIKALGQAVESSKDNDLNSAIERARENGKGTKTK